MSASAKGAPVEEEARVSRVDGIQFHMADMARHRHGSEWGDGCLAASNGTPGAESSTGGGHGLGETADGVLGGSLQEERE